MVHPTYKQCILKCKTIPYTHTCQNEEGAQNCKRQGYLSLTYDVVFCCPDGLLSFPPFISSPLKLIAECEQVKTERETELIIEQVLIAMSEMGLDRERTLQVGHQYNLHSLYLNFRLCFLSNLSSASHPAFSSPVLTNRCIRSLQCHLQSAG